MKQKLLINLVLFQAGWFVCVLLGGAWALLFTCAYLLVHFRWISDQLSELRLIVWVLIYGLVQDSLLIYFGVFRWSDSVIGVPLWLLLIWVLFATTLCHGYRWLLDYPWLAALIGGIAGPLSYYAGATLTGAEFPQGMLTFYLVLGVVWAGLMPGLLRFSKAWHSAPS